MRKECKCGLATGILFSNLDSLQNKLTIASRFGESLPTEVIRQFIDVTVQNEGHIDDIKSFCGIDINDEKNLLRNIGNDMARINTSEIRTKISRDMIRIFNSTKLKLARCSNE